MLMSLCCIIGDILYIIFYNSAKCSTSVSTQWITATYTTHRALHALQADTRVSSSAWYVQTRESPICVTSLRVTSHVRIIIIIIIIVIHSSLRNCCTNTNYYVGFLTPCLAIYSWLISLSTWNRYLIYTCPTALRNNFLHGMYRILAMHVSPCTVHSGPCTPSQCSLFDVHLCPSTTTPRKVNCRSKVVVSRWRPCVSPTCVLLPICVQSI